MPQQVSTSLRIFTSIDIPLCSFLGILTPLLDILGSQKALNISKYINLDVFPIKINSKALLEDGILKEEIINIENFISSLQNGDEKYVKSMGGLYLKKINEQALKAQKELNLKEEIFLKTAAGISVMVFLVLI